MRRRWLALVVPVLLVAAPASAQTATVTMRANTTRVAVGDTLVLRVRAEVQGATVQDVQLPEMPGFQILSRQVSRPFSFSFGFGNQRRTVQSSTEYILQLRALEPGTHRIAPAKAIVGGRTFTSDPLTVVVTGSRSTPGATPDGGATSVDQALPGQGQAEVDEARFDPNAFLRTVVDEGEPYVGQQVTVSIYLYVRGGLRSSPHIEQEPSTDGFWIQDLLPATRSLDATQQVVRGNLYRVYELRRFAAFPLHPGKLTIGPMEVEIEMGSLFDMFRGRGPVERTGAPATLDVRPLPPPSPDDTVVGDFQIHADLDRSTVTTGDAATLRVEVKGTGNLRDVELSLPDVPGLRVLAPQIDDDIEAPGDRVGGTRTFEWLLVPEKPGTYPLPALGFHAFDPDGATYEDVRTQQLTLEAVGQPIQAAGEEPEAGQPPSPDTGGGDKNRFGPIRAQSALARHTTPVVDRAWYVPVLAVPPFLFLAIFGVGRARQRWRERGAARAPARSVRRKLQAAREHAKAGEPRAFYGAVAQAMTRALALRLDEPVGGYTHGELRARLDARGMEPELAGRIMDELEGCDYARFSASGITTDEMDRCLARVGALLERVERFRPAGPEAGGQT